MKPGFVKTTMTHGLKPPPFAGEADDVARRFCGPSIAAGRRFMFRRHGDG